MLVRDFTPTLIEVEGRAVAPRSTQAYMGIVTQVWAPKRWGPFVRKHWDYGPEHAVAMLELEIELDDQSGEDCALFPVLRIIFKPGSWIGSSFADLAGRTFVEGVDAIKFEAHYGNDAPHFENNRVHFHAGGEPGQLQLDWQAQYRWYPNDAPEPFRFSGPIRIQGLWLDVMRDVDAAPIVAAAMPGFALHSLAPPVITDEDRTAFVPKKFAHWRVHWYAA